MQFNIFHAYTVDDHTILTIRNLRRFFVDKFTYEFPTAHQVAKTLCKPEVLFLAGLFHDIAKGRNGAHEILGAKDALDFAKQHNLSKKDGDMISWLVRRHLDFSAVAQKKDLSDPEVIHEFASLVGDQEHLDYLYLLTVADVCATSSDVWNDWKNSLFIKLYNETSHALLSESAPKDKQNKAIQTQEKAKEALSKKGISSDQYNDLWASLSETEFFSKQTPEDVIRITQLLNGVNKKDNNLLLKEQTNRGASELVIYMPDRDFLFAHIAYCLDQFGANVYEAQIFGTSDNMTLVIIYFLDGETGSYLSSDRHDEVLAKLHAQIQTDEIEPMNTKFSFAQRRTRHFETPTEVNFIQISDAITELHIDAKDGPGLLARIGCALKEENIRLHDAKITTVGEKAEDVFLISDTENHAIKNKKKQQKIEHSLRSIIAE